MRIDEGHQLPPSGRREAAREFKNFDRPVCKAFLYVASRSCLYVPALSRSIRNFSTAINPRSLPPSSLIHLFRQSFFLVPPVSLPVCREAHAEETRFRGGSAGSSVSQSRIRQASGGGEGGGGSRELTFTVKFPMGKVLTAGFSFGV
jgi:hypothetical protein